MTDTPVATRTTAISRLRSERVSSIRGVVAPVALGVGAIALWQLATVALRIEPFILPSPSSIAAAVAQNLPSMWTSSLVTGSNALVGLLIGAVLAAAAAVLASVVRVLDLLSAPIVQALAVVPIVALAPALYTMFGASAETARQLVAAIAVFVPVYVNTLRGLSRSQPVHRDLMRAYAAGPWQRARSITIPGALPFFFTGLRISSSLAVISALIAEYFGGPVGGLGKSITSAASASNYSSAYAYVLGAVVLGLVFYVASYTLETLVTRRGRR